MTAEEYLIYTNEINKKTMKQVKLLVVDRFYY